MENASLGRHFGGLLAAGCAKIARPRWLPWSWVWLGLISTELAHSGSILREVYQGIGGSALSDLTNAPAYPNSPSFTNLVTDFFESPTDFDENYGQRMHGFIIPPTTGSYTFWLATDDAGALFLSTDETPAHQRLICSVPGWSSPREWTKFAEQKSALVSLTAGRAYYINALQKEGNGGDNLAVRWLRPGGIDEGPIPASYLLPWGTSFTPPQITQQPTNTTAVDGQNALFIVGLKNTDLVSVQWLRNGSTIIAPTDRILSYGPVTLADNGTRFSAILTNKLGTTNTTEAVLTVTPDVTPPTLVGALNIGRTLIQLTFSEPVANSSATLLINYQVSGGIVVTAATLGPDLKTVQLTTLPLDFGTSYTVTVNGVEDRAATPNQTTANTSLVFLAQDLVSRDIGGAGGAVEVVSLKLGLHRGRSRPLVLSWAATR